MSFLIFIYTIYVPIDMQNLGGASINFWILLHFLFLKIYNISIINTVIAA